jgi:nitrogen fixation NifU-like protein
MHLDSLYQQIILDHYRHPRRRGLRQPFDAETRQVNPTCGDEVTLRVHLSGDRIADVSYDALGCSISQAATSVMTELVVDRPVTEALTVHDAFVRLVQGDVEPDEEVLQDAVAFGGVSRYPARVKCALLGWMAMKDAVRQAMTTTATTTKATTTTTTAPTATATTTTATGMTERSTT